MSKETLRKYLLTSSAEAIPQARPSLLSCFTNAENPKPQLQDRLSAAGEALESCSETALQSWFDPLEILLDQEAGTLAVRFPHAFFGIRFSSLFQKLLKPGDPCPCCGRPIKEGLPTGTMIFLSWLAEGMALREAAKSGEDGHAQ